MAEQQYISKREEERLRRVLRWALEETGIEAREARELCNKYTFLLRTVVNCILRDQMAARESLMEAWKHGKPRSGALAATQNSPSPIRATEPQIMQD